MRDVEKLIQLIAALCHFVTLFSPSSAWSRTALSSSTHTGNTLCNGTDFSIQPHGARSPNLGDTRATDVYKTTYLDHWMCVISNVSQKDMHILLRAIGVHESVFSIHVCFFPVFGGDNLQSRASDVGCPTAGGGKARSVRLQDGYRLAVMSYDTIWRYFSSFEVQHPGQQRRSSDVYRYPSGNLQSSVVWALHSWSK